MHGISTDRRRLLYGAFAYAIGRGVNATSRPTPTAVRQITDMAARRVGVPEDVRRIYVAHDPPAIFLSSVAPDLMVGFPFKLSAAAKHFLPATVDHLPTVGGASRVDPETLLALRIDVAVVWNIRGSPDLFAEQLILMGIPTLMVDASPFQHYPAAFRFLGKLVRREQRAELLARALEDCASRLSRVVGAIPHAQRVRVYYADSPDGLKSQCATAFRGEIVPLAGGQNVLPCTAPDSMTASTSLDPETLLRLDPDVIVARTHAIASHFEQDDGLRQLRAVRQRRLYAFPELPFDWAERPHSQFKMLALQWLANLLYPDRYPFDFGRSVRSFFQLFYDLELTDGDIAQLQR